ncbi:GAF domain-containing protein [Allostreptomyces psammosilenae]|uniref:GAF domain-containing protein n=1 Tax=Allostreptomyces psammosilenae TaxID=1892865 RepID=A0A852ZPS2_9ACTN|nr:GAF domain-containing protein [Allostreptomyces psammosilenae]NYI03487.1 GAF domain-containing protein [Allostreptomyces psammosilenae]
MTDHQSPGGSDRTARLTQLGLNDSDSDQAFERFAELAARLTGAPIAMVNFVNDERQMFRGLCLYNPSASDEAAGVAPQGGGGGGQVVPYQLSRRDMPLTHGFCPHVVALRSPLALNDVLAYPRFSGNPVVNELGVRSYLGTPLIDDTGTVLGTLCVLDHSPRDWGRERLKGLGLLAEALLSEVRLRDRDGGQTGADQPAAHPRQAAPEPAPPAPQPVEQTWPPRYGFRYGDEHGYDQPQEPAPQPYDPGRPRRLPW